MSFTHKKGTHRARPFYWLRWWPLVKTPVALTRAITFDSSNKYMLPVDDQADVNKLFGVAFGRVHMNSARFGWRYVPETNMFHLYGYYYRNGVRDFQFICECNPYRKYNLTLKVSPYTLSFEVYNPGGYRRLLVVDRYDNKKWGWLLGPFFGGNRPAPHTMKINLEKV